MPSSEWCRVVDAALANPNTDQARREEYIATGQAQHCPHQMFMPPRKLVPKTGNTGTVVRGSVQGVGQSRSRSIFESCGSGEGEKSRLPSVEAKCLHECADFAKSIT